MSPTPRRLGRYELLAELGRGAMGAVYRARDPTIERDVAIKTISITLAQDDPEDFRTRFLKEAKAAGRLSHPNIVTIFDAGEDAGTAYIVMEYLQGASLREIMVPGRALPLVVWIPIAAQIAEGLACAHAAHVVHRDIKPANIMIAPSGRATITDFGIARMQGVSGTQTGMVFGSPTYMSPEQIQGLALDHRSDIFSLGSLMYEMATGHKPFGGDPADIGALLREIVLAPPEKPSALNSDLPEVVERAILHAMMKSPRERPQDAQEVARELRRALRAIEAATTVQLVRPRVAALDDTVRLPATATPAPAARSDEDFRAQLLADIDAFAATTLAPAPPAEATPSAGAAHAPLFPVLKEELLAEETSRPIETPNLLRDLARQAAAVRRNDEGGEQQAAAALLARAKALDGKVRALFRYLNEFVRHLNTIRPDVPRTYLLLGIGGMTGLSWREAFVDYRTRALSGHPVISRIALSARLEGRGAFDVVREGVAMDKLRGQLFELKIPFTAEECRNERSMLTETHFHIPFALGISAHFEVDEDARGVRLQWANVERLGVMAFSIAPDALGPAFFDEFGRALLGQQHRLFAFTEPADLKTR